MNQADIERALLERLYEPYFRERNAVNLHSIREELGIDEARFWNTVDEMSHKGLIRARTIGGYYEIDAGGAIKAEKEGVSPEKITEENQHIRTVVLNELANVYEKSGHFADSYIETMSQELDVDINLLVNNLQILEDLGYVETVSMGSYKITYRGFDSVREWRQRKIKDEQNETRTTNFEETDFIKSGKPIKVFICHGKEDKEIARKLHGKLRILGVQTWFDEENLLPGQDWELEIIKAVRESDIVLVCLSTKSVQKTGFIQKEIKLALDAADERPEGKIFLIPARIDDCVMPSRLKSRQWVDLFDERGFERLVLALKRYCTSD
jgi:DNA-binding PadR family transcriptional regulator